MKIKRKIALLTLGLMATTTFSAGVLNAQPAGNPPGSNTPSATFSALSVGGFSVDTVGRLSHTSGVIDLLTNRVTSTVGGGRWALWLTNNSNSIAGTAGNLSNPTIYAENTGDSMAGYFTSDSEQPTLYGVNTFAGAVGGAGVRGSSARNAGVAGFSTDYYGVYGLSANSYSIYGLKDPGSSSHSAIAGVITNTLSPAAAISGSTLSATGLGVSGQATAGGTGVYGYGTTGRGVYGLATTGTGVYGYASSTGRGVMGVATSSDGVYGSSTSGTGVRAIASGSTAGLTASNTSTGGAVSATNNSSSSPTILANNSNTAAGAMAVQGSATSNIGVAGDATTGIGLRGTSTTGYGVSSTTSSTGTAVYGLASSTSAGNAATFISNLPSGGYTNLTLNRNGLDFSLSQPELAGTTVDFDITNDGLSVIANDNSSGAVSRDHVFTQSSTGTRISSTEGSSPFIAGSYLDLGMSGTYGVQLASPSGFQFGQFDNAPTYSGAATFKPRLNMAATGELSNPGGNVTIADSMDVTGTLEAPTIRTATDGFRAYASGATYAGGSFYAQGQSTYILGGITNTSTTVEPNSGGYVYIDDSLRVNSTVTQKLTNTAWTTWSDGRLKDIQSSFNKGLAEIMKIDPIIYKYKKDNVLEIKDDEAHVGIIAQEIQKVFPEAITTDERGLLQFTPDSIYWAMLNAIKELAGQDEVLKAKVTALEAQNKVLEARLSALEAKLK